MEETANLKMKKPGLNDYINITDLTSNFDILDTKAKEFTDKDAELKSEIDTKVDKTTYDSNNEQIRTWATNLESRIKKKVIENATTNSGGAYNLHLKSTNNIFLMAHCTALTTAPAGTENQIILLSPVISNANNIFVYALEVYHKESDKHHDVVIKPHFSLGTLTVWYLDTTDLTINTVETVSAPIDVDEEDEFDS